MLLYLSMHVFLKNPISGVEVEILTSTVESKRNLFKIKSTMRANQLNKAPFHYHDNFSEHFQVIDGELNMTVEKDRKNLVLKAGESFLVKEKCPHTFWNNSNKPVTYIVDISPAMNFEKALKINHALAANGKASKKGTPKNVFHIAYLARLGNTWFYGYPKWLQSSIFMIISGFGQLFGINKKLEKLLNL